MKDLLRRLMVAPWSATLLVIASVLANVLALATPLFVIQVLNRFLSVGELSTLIALAAGAVVAIVFEVILRASRYSLARAQGAVQDMNLYTGIGILLGAASPRELKALLGKGANPVDNLSAIQQGQGPHHVCALLDFPFSAVFVVVVYLISPTLGLVVGGIVTLYLIVSIVSIRLGQHRQQVLSASIRSAGGHLKTSMAPGARTRLFTSASSMIANWRKLAAGQVGMIRVQSKRLSSQQSSAVLFQAALTVTVISIGAMMTLNGTLDVGSLIGVNILAARALMPISRFASTYEASQSSARATKEIARLKGVALASADRRSLIGSVDHISLRGVTARPTADGIAYFHRLEATLKPGQVTAVYSEDRNAATGFLDLLTQLETPADGAILVNDVNLDSISFDWWRGQVGLVPANPEFRDASLRDNFLALGPGTDETIQKALQDAGVRKAVESHPQGLDMPLTADMAGLPAEIRWRLGLARALYLEPPVLLFEYAAEVIGPALSDRLADVAQRFAASGRIVVLATSDRENAKKAHQIIELPRGKTAMVHKVRDTEADVAPAPFASVPDDWRDQQRDAAGADLSGTRRASQAMAFAVIALVAALGGWSYFATLDRVTSAKGEVVPSAQVQTIETLEGGIVSEILVQEGQQVTHGQPIMELEAVADDADIGELSARLGALTMNVARLDAELRGAETFEVPETTARNNRDFAKQAEALFRTRQAKKRLDIKSQEYVVRQREQAIVEIDTRIKTTSRQIGIVSQQVEISEGLLSEELTNRMLHLDIVSSLAQFEAENAQAKAAKRTAEAALDEAKTQLELIEASYEEEARMQLDAATQELRELGNRMGKLQNTRDRRVLRSPMDGTVKALSTFSRGAVVGPGEVVAEVVPTDDAFIIEALLSVSEIGFVRPGMEARVRLATQDAYRFGALKATIQSISPDSFTDEDGRAYYKLRLSTREKAFPGKQQNYDLVPGIQVNASVLLGERTVLEYLAAPILRNFSTAFRER